MERANDKLYVGLYNPNYGQIHQQAQHSFTINPIRKKEKEVYQIADYAGRGTDVMHGGKKDMGLAREKEFNSIISGINKQVYQDMANEKNQAAGRINRMFGKELELDLDGL